MGRNKDKEKRVAKERIDILFHQAERRFEEYPKLSDRYVELALRIAQRMRVKVPKIYKRKFCKKCKGYWVPGKTVRVRTTRGKVTYTCLVCGKQRRIPFLKEKSAQKKEK